MKEQLDHIADTLKGMGYGAYAVQHPPTAEYPNECNRVYLNTGSAKMKAYLDVQDTGPSFKVFADFPEGHQTGMGSGAPLHGEILTRHNRQQEAIVRQALTPAVAVVYIEITGDIDGARKAFGLDNGERRYGPSTPKAEAETEHTAKAPAASLTSTPGM